jgi:uncharacterized NAD(P)/FAD-binding protein YdhS
MARPDAPGLGLDVGENGTLIGTGGKSIDRVFVLGPYRRGQLWETTAVRELRQQAADLAGDVLEALKDRLVSSVPKPHWYASVRVDRESRRNDVR